MPTRLLFPPFLLPLLWFTCFCNAKFVGLTFHVTEHSEPNKWIGNILQSITLPPQQVRSMTVESPPHEEWTHLVHIDTVTGDIRTAGGSQITLDREAICPLRGSGERIQECRISLLISINQKVLVSLNLIIDDLNDSSPVFFRSGQIVKELVFTALETAAVGETIGVLPIAVDPDLKSPSSSITYHLIGDDLPFSLLTSVDNPELCLSKPLDFERVPLYTFFLQACETHRTEHLCSSLHITVHVENVNDNFPVFLNSTYNVVINEDTPVGTTVLVVEAIDNDAPPFGNVSYLMIGNKKSTEPLPFAVDERSGQIFLKSPLLEPKKYSFVIEATDDDSSTSPANKRATALIVVFVADVNNHRPIIEMKPFSNTSLPVYASVGGDFVVELQEEVAGPIVLAYLTVTDHDEGVNALCSCRLNDSPFSGAFELTKVNQLSPQTNVYRLVAGKPLDAENPLLMSHLIQPVEADRCRGLAGFLVLEVTCSDSGSTPLETHKSIYIALRGIDEYPTTFVFPDATDVYRLSLEENTKIGTKLMELIVNDKDTGRCIQISTSLENNEILVEPESGTLVLAAPLDFEKATSITFTVSGNERGPTPSPQPTATATVIMNIVNINDNKPRLIGLKPVENKICQKMTFDVVESVNQTVDCFSVEVEEEMEIGYVIRRLEAFDADAPNTTDGFIFSLLGSYAPLKSQKVEKLKLSPLEVTKKGDLVVAGRLDREQINWVDLLISTSDGEENSLSLLRVNLVDINDNVPVWQFPSPTDYHISVSIFAQVDAVISRVQALDADTGLLNGALEYTILPQVRDSVASLSQQDHLAHSFYGAQLFSLNPHTGKLSVKQVLPNQTEVPYRLDLLVTDKGKRPLESSAHLLISLVDRPFNEMQAIQPNPVVSSNNLQNDGVETIPSSFVNSAEERTETQSSTTQMENWIHIIGISAGALTLLFFIVIISIVLCKRMQSGSRSFCQKSPKPLELKPRPRQSWSSNIASPVHEVLLDKRDREMFPPPLLPAQKSPGPRSSPPLSVVGIPTCSVAFGGAPPPQVEMNSTKNVPVIVSVAVLPPVSPTSDIHFPNPTDYVVISDSVTVASTKCDWKVVNDTGLMIAEK